MIPHKVSAVLVTKGDVDLEPITDSIRAAGVSDIVVWDNSRRKRDLSCYGRYRGILEAKHPWIYHQDDDLIAPVGEIIRAYNAVTDRHAIVANNRPEESWPLTAMGTIFHRSLGCPAAFKRYTKLYGEDADFYRVSDVIFAYQRAYRRIWVGYEDLPQQVWADRMHLQPDHYVVRERARLRTLALPNWIDA